MRHQEILKNHPRLRRFLGWWWWRVRRLLPAPGYTPDFPLARLPAILPRIRFVRPGDDVEGWLTRNEAATLYFLARMTNAPVLEIGAWVGRSTICLARGLIDAGGNHQVFTCELNSTLANFRPTGPDAIGFYHPPDSPTPLGVHTAWQYENEIKPVMTRPGGLIGQLEQNLRAAGCRHRVEIHLGDFRAMTPRPFRLAFADVMHGAEEIHHNTPALKRYLAPGSLLACHDTSEENQALLESYFTFSETAQVDSLFVGRVTRL